MAYIDYKDVPTNVLKEYGIDVPNENVQVNSEVNDSGTDEIPANEPKFDYSDNNNYFGINQAELEENIKTAKQVQTDFSHDNMIHTSNIYRKYFANSEENLKVAKSINAEIPLLTVDKITNSSKDFDKAVEMVNRKHKIDALLPDGEKDLALGRLYEEYPDIFKLNEVDGAIALHNVKNVKAVKDIIEAAKEGYNAYKLNDELNSIGRNAYEGKELTEKDFARIKEIRKLQKEMAMNMPDFLADPAKAITYGTLQQVPMMFSQGGRSQLYSVPAAGMVYLGTMGITKNPAAASAAARSAYSSISRIGYGVEMFKDTVGNYYLDYKEYQNAEGKQLLTDNEARLAATIAAAGEAYLEVANWGKVMDMLKGTPGGEEAKEVLSGIVANAADKTSAKTQIAYYIKKRFGKAFGVFADEIKEEGQQSIWTDAVHNAFAKYKPGGTLETISVGEMIGNAVDSMWEAVPAVAGMTVGGNAVSGTKMVRRMASALQDQATYAAEVQNNVSGQIMIEQLIENKKDNKLAKENPEIYNQLLTGSLEGTRYENVVVDADMLTQDEKGQENAEGKEIYYQLAEANGMTREEAEAALDSGAKLTIPMAKYVEAVEDNTVREKLKNYISFDAAENCFARNKKVATDMKRKLDRIYAKDWQGEIETVQNFVNTEFEDEQERAVANQILMEYNNPVEGVKALRAQYQQELDKFINPVVETMRAGMKQGTTLLNTDDDGLAIGQEDAHIGGKTRITENDFWYSNYYKANKKAPSEKEMRELAKNALLGDNPYGIMTEDMFAEGDEAIQYYQEQFDNIDSVLATLDKLEPKMAELDVSDLVAMEGLSKEGIEVFKTIKRYVKNSLNNQSKESAAAGAALVAHKAETYAAMRRQMGDANYTALDYLKDKKFKYGENQNGDVLKQKAAELLSYEENQYAIKEYFQGIKRLEDLNPKDITQVSNEDRFQNRYSLKQSSIQYYEKLRNEGVVDPLGNTISFEPVLNGKTVSVEEYVSFFIDKKKNDKTEVSATKTLAFQHIEDTISNPEAIITNSNGQTMYIKVYSKTKGGMFNKCIVTTSSDGNNKFYTLRMSHNVKNKKSTLNEIKNVIQSADKILYIRGRQTGHPLQPTDQYASPTDANLHISGTFILPQYYKNVNNNLSETEKLLTSNNVVSKEMETIGEKYRSEEFKDYLLKAPDGTESNYSMLQWTLIRTEKFKELYGDWETEFQRSLFDNNLKEAIEVNVEEKFKNTANRKAAALNYIKPLIGPIKTNTGYFNITEDFADSTFNHGRNSSNMQYEDLRVAALSTLKDGLNHLIYLGEKEDNRHTLDKTDNKKPGHDRYYAYWIKTENGKALVYLRVLDTRIEKERQEHEIKTDKSNAGKVKLYLHDVFTEEEVNTMRAFSYKDATKIVEERVRSGNAGKDFGFYVIAEFLNKPTNMKVDLLENGEPDLSKIDDVPLQQSSDTLMQSAGVNADTANMELLQKALNMYNSGLKDAEEIYAETGWHIGMDGKWRFEIPDNLDRINPEALPRKGESVELRYIYDNPALYEAYPWLADIRVEAVELSDSMRGQTDSETITINANRLFPKDNKGYKATLFDEEYRWNGITVTDAAGNEMPGAYHFAFKELQKAKDERRALVDVLQELDSKINDVTDRLQRAKEINNEFAVGNWSKMLETFKAAREIIANAEDYGAGAFSAILEEDMEKKRVEVGKTLIHEIQHVIQSYENFAMGGNVTQVQKQISIEMDKTRRAIRRISKYGWDVFMQHVAIGEAFNRMDLDAMEQEQKDFDFMVKNAKLSQQDLERIMKLGAAYNRLEKQYKDKADSYTKYLHLHGEQEARLASEKAEIATKLESLKESYNLSEQDILNKWSEGKDQELVEQAKMLVELYAKAINDSSTLTAEEDALYDELLANPELDDLIIMLDDKMFNDEDYEKLQKQYQNLAIKGINEYNAIIVFGGDVVTGMAVRQQNVKGYTEFTSNGERIVNLLQTADQSTFMHEMAHIFYDDLKELALDERATEQIKKDWNTLKDWASWNADQLKEYEGTASYKEFTKRNAEILEAQEKGYVIRDGKQIVLDKLLNEWAQERFARGFEVYLESGKAPSKPLQGAFAKFRQWLSRIYKAVTGAGAKPSKEVKEVMDRMIATQEEIDNAVDMAEIEGLKKQGLFRYLNETSQDMWERNLENIREDVAKKVMKIAMRDMTDKAKEERAEAIKKEREAARERISKEPIFVAWQFLQQNPNLSTSDVVEQIANMTVEEYVKQLRALGGSLDGAVDQYMDMYEKRLPMVTRDEIRQAAEEAVSNSYYRKLAEAFEVQALEQYVKDEKRLSKKLSKIEAKDEAERKEAEKAIRDLDAKQRQQEERDRRVRSLQAEQRENERLQERQKKLELQILDLRKQKEDIRREARINREARVQEVKEQKQKVIDSQIEKLQAKQKQLEEERKRFRLFEAEEGKGKRIYRDALDQYVQNIEKYAEKKMAALPISDATNPAMWSRMAENYSNTSLELFARGEYELAARQKRIAFFYRHMAELAEKNRKKVDKRTTTLMAHTRTMLKNKNVAANDRYLFNHMMYNFGLANKDALKPPAYPASYKDVLLTYDANLELSYIDQDGNIDLPDWLTGAMGAEAGPYNGGYQSLRMDQLELLYNVMNNIYKAGSEAKKLKTTKDIHGNALNVDDVVGEIVGNAMGNIPFQANEDTTGAGNETTWEMWKRRANEAHVALLKPETILRQLGDSAIKYIYNPIKQAADNEMVETEALASKIRGITEAYRDSIALMYENQGHANYEKMADQDMADLRTKKQYKIGTSLLTKENVLVLAFNWGTDMNRKRVMDGFNVTQAQVESVLAELNSADWQMVINVWELFDDYWPRLQQVEANISGVVMEKQEALPFTIVDKTGFTYNLQGGYYPIKYDRVKNMRIGDHAQDEVARMSMAGMTRLGIGLGNTKERMETVPYKIRNDFGVIQESLTDTIHNICMREAVRDVNRIIRDPGFSQFMGEYYGQATTKMLENWILDCWAKEPQQKDFMEKAAQWIRQKQTVACLGFRTSTALLNVCNLPYVMDYLGPARAMAALKNYYSHPSDQFALCMEKSVFLRDRAETMDRDMGDVLKRNKQNPGDKVMNSIEEKAFWFISRTDLMLACPLWVSEYERVFQESMDKKMNPEDADREAVMAGDAAVRRVFGSGQVQDLARVQKGSEFTKTFTMYYSFFSVVHNALMMKVFESRQAHYKGADLAKAMQPLAEGILFWMILPAAMEACIRAATSGDDKDKEAKNLGKKFLTTLAGTAVGGIPLMREAIPAYLDAAMGGRYYGVSGTPIGDTADQIYRIFSAMKSNKKTKLDVVRDIAAVTSSVTGLPKTMIDGLITAMQFIDHGRLTPEDIRHYLWAVMFDKNPDKK